MSADAVKLGFKLLKMHQRFLDRRASDHLHPVIRRFFMRAGGAIRITARRLLKKAPQKSLSEMPSNERTNYETAMKLYKRGRRRELSAIRKKGQWVQNGSGKPRRPDKTASPGRPPYLHVTWDNGTSPLKHRLWFALKDNDRNTLLIGPAAIGQNRTRLKRGGITTLRELEARHPFMEPAYKAIQPRFADFLQAAAR